MMAEFDGQFVYRGTLGVVCRSQNNGSAMLSVHLPGNRRSKKWPSMEWGSGRSDS
jgi:hypothetical protein